VRDKAKASWPERSRGQQEKPHRGIEAAKGCSTHLPNETQMDFLPVLLTQTKRIGQIVK